MNLSWIDWAILIVSVVALRFVSLSTKSYMKGVADFLSGNRSAGRYLLTIAGEMGSVGAVSFVAYFQMYAEAGLPPVWWNMMNIPVSVIIFMSGWIYYRFRETRAMTMAQFLEMRYSRRFRVFAGFLCWACGILNFGIFPAVTARFFIYFCGLPNTFQIPGIPLGISTFAVVMIVNLVLALTFVNMGGQVSVMVTECVQGILSSIFFLIITATLFVKLQWSQIIRALEMAAKSPDASLIHPYHTSQVGDFSIWFFLIGLFGSFYTYMSWQGTQGFYSSARNPHEQQMGGIISVWRNVPRWLLTALLPLSAVAVLKLPEFIQQASAAGEVIKTIKNPMIQNEMTVPIVLAHFLPIGIKGMLATAMMFFSFTSLDTYMHSWGSILIQDVVLPLRKEPMTPDQHIRWLRWSITGVAVFGFFFSLLYPPEQKIMMFFAITGTIWIGGSGAVIAGGLYWRRGTTAAAYSALILGAVLGVGGLFADQIWMAIFAHKCPVNGQWLWFIAMVASSVVYVLVSFASGGTHRAANLQKILHRGEFALPTEGPKPVMSVRSKIVQFIGITPEFTMMDRVLALALVLWTFGWFMAFLVITAVHFTVGTSTEWWAKFWHLYVLLQFAIAVPAVIWFTVGGIVDMRALFETLKNPVRDHTDDGRVKHTADDVVDLDRSQISSSQAAAAGRERGPDEPNPSGAAREMDGS
jgi:solute:Na+ symporter, SSS family